MSEVIQLASLEAAFKANHAEIKSLIDKADGEIKVAGKVANETKSALDKLAQAGEEIGKRIDKLEARNDRMGDGRESVKSLGQQFIDTDDCKALMSSGRNGRARMSVKQIVNATGQNQPIVPSDRRPGIIAEPNRTLRIRDLIPSGRTNSNLIEYTKENVFTNSAAAQYEASPERFEAVAKAQSNITFTLSSTAVITLAHYIKASKQVLSDAPALQSYIDGRLIYGLKLVEEDNILNGDGTSGQLNGLRNQATAYNRGSTNQTRLDTIRKVITQLQLANYSGSPGIVLNPSDWEIIELSKDSENRYMFANPTSQASPTLWGSPVVVSNTMPADSFLVGAFDMACMLWDREDAAVQVGFENDDFTKNMVTILAEERLALEVSRTAALIKGTFSALVG